ncbi:MAG TPA: SpoIIE family protein phosphatase [Gemmataceae bacterium]|jgi:serine phosphatase RsbU (regulator of sigma subunit)|nr:SpoIIE family protein phosphatase [Gemmataceae bacterium]
MARLIQLLGGEVEQSYTLDGETTILGRQNDSTVCLTGKNVSRHHAQILRRGSGYFIEDMGSSNGTFLNGQRLNAYSPQSFTDEDRIQIGAYVFRLSTAPSVEMKSPSPEGGAPAEPSLVVRESVNATSVKPGLLGSDPAARLHTVLELTKSLARTLDVDQLLEKLLEQLMLLYPQADRAMVILLDGERLVLRARNDRRPPESGMAPFSRTIVRRALEEGVALLSDDVKADTRFIPSDTLTQLNLHSVLCVPLVTSDGHRLGVIQIDRSCKGFGFGVDDLQLLAAVAMQVSVVMENAALHAERLREERLKREIALAREIQEGFLPDDIESADQSFEILGRVFPALQVAGDFYDFFPLPEGRFAFSIGDVSGKGIPAALFMGSCRTLCRYLAKEGLPPAQVLAKLNTALADENPTCMFVTLIYGVLTPATGEVTLISAGHPPPVLRHIDGSVATITLPSGRLLGYPGPRLQFLERKMTLEPGEALVFFTDGLIEARMRRTPLFGFDRVVELVRSFDADAPLADWAEETRHAVEDFVGSSQLSDDLTLLLLRRTV